MRKTFTYLSLWIVALFAGVASASAQKTFEVKGVQYPTNDLFQAWSHVAVTFSYDEVAKAAGYESAAAMQEALEAVQNPNSETSSTSMFWCCDSTEQKNLTNWNTQGGVGGFWHAPDGTVVPFGNDNSVDHKSVFFTQLITDADNDEFTYWIGQYPNRCVGGTTYTTTIYLKNGENTVTFNFELFVKKPIDLPEATNEISKLNVIGSTDTIVDITLRKGADFKVKIDDIAALTGVASSELTPVIGQMLMAWNLDENATEGDCKTDTLMKYTQNNGFYFYVGDEATHVATATNPSLGDLWNISDVAFDEEIDSLVVSVYPGNIKAGDKFTTVLYVVYGDKAHQINLTVNVVEPTVVTPEDYEKVGEMELTLERNKDLGYNVTSNSIDVAAIAELLGCGADEIVFMAVNKDGGIDDDWTATPNPGFWMNSEGVNIGYNDANRAWFACFDYAESTIDIGHEAAMFEGGELCGGKLYLVFKEKLYEITVNLKIEEVKQVDTFTEVGSEEIYVQGVENYSEYEIGNVSINFERAKELTGLESGDFAVYVYAAPSEENPEELTFTNKTSANGIGFWLTAEGYRGAWADGNTKVFFQNYSNGTFNWGHYPNEDPAGTIYTGKLFLVNPDNGNYYTINYTVEFVEDGTQVELVGEENILAYATDEDLTKLSVDFTSAMEALEIEDESLLESVEWKAPVSARTYTVNGLDDVNGGFPFNENGYVVLTEDEVENILFYAGFIFDGESNKYLLNAYTLEPIADGASYIVKLALDYNGKRYIFNVKLVNEATYVGIDGVNAIAGANAGNVYDLSGRVVRTNVKSVNGLAKGVYILNGKKYIVK
ncbi:MAG: DUF4859 domain-containing protein [Bacteroidaceae bacterium]|nr:DUF4859 domain-containing protein [Bacteroidaceae bacterium]